MGVEQFKQIDMDIDVIVGKRVSFATWSFLLYLAEELIHMIIKVVESKEIASLVTIVDPFALAFSNPPAVNLLP